MKNFRMNRKGISPIFATLILIAIAVIAGVVVYMFTSGTLSTMTGTSSALTEKVTVQGASISVASGVTVYAQSTNSLNVTVTSLIIKNTNGDVVSNLALTTGNLLTNNGALVTIGPITGATNIVAGTAYSITLTTARGGSFVSPQVVAGT
jgi:flagellin-like protein